MELASLDLATPSVVQAMHKLRDGSIRFSEPKTVKSRGMVALSPTAALAFREHREKQEAMADELRAVLAGDGLVFCNADGSSRFVSSTDSIFPEETAMM